MKSIFLPKEINKSDGSPVCYDVQSIPIKTEIHWHSCAEIIHMQKGEALIFSNESWSTLCEGDTVFFPPGHLHCCHCTDEGAKRIVIGLEEKLFPYLGKEHELALSPFNGDCIKNYLSVPQSQSLNLLFSQLEARNGSVVMHDKLTDMIIIQSIYCELLKFWESVGVICEAGEKSSIVRQVQKIIESRFSEPLEANRVARELNISYSYLSTLLHRELKTNFGDLLLKARIDASKKLLLTTDMSITDIALESGFTDSSYFIKKFRTYTGTTPHKYRSDNLNVLK